MRKLLFVALLVIVTLLLLLLPPGTISLATLQHYQSKLLLWHALHPWLAALAFFASYVLVATLSIPGATLLTLLGGALFGLVQGTLLVALGATCGATLAMLLSRYLLRDWVQKRFSKMMAKVNKGMAQDGTRYLFALRLAPVFPFFLVNLLMGLTPVSAGRYFAVSFVGMLPAIVVYLNAGKELSQLRSAADILSPGMILTFALIGFLPLVSRWVIRNTVSRRVDKR
ncbi:TVP38/TMEM64 family protein [Dryocola sp. LX212]